ncbi:polysaccharide pyruvyl transferase family protein [Arthrobacter sp. TMT4-20]
MTRILILHAYSALNAGDGLLVEETLKIVNKLAGASSEIIIAASYPCSFPQGAEKFLCSMPTKRGYSRDYLSTLFRVRSFDMVIGVGGGYLRGGTFSEFIKALLVHGPQLIAASLYRGPSVYMPQSVGPFRFGTRTLVRFLLKRITVLYLRDDKSMQEFDVLPAIRGFDLATVDVNRFKHEPVPVPEPVLSVRAVRNRLPPLVRELASKLYTFDAYVQSTTRGNDDRSVTEELGYVSLLPEIPQAIGNVERPRVFIAVRLHAALMALKAGHYVIHLAYERKGFGAFADLGLGAYVHNVNRFSINDVVAQVRSLSVDPEERERYRTLMNSSKGARDEFRYEMEKRLKDAMQHQGPR